MKAFSFANASSIGLKSGLYGGRKPKLRAHAFDRRAYVRLLVHGEVVEDHDITPSQRRHQNLIDIREETRIINRPIENRGRGQALEPQGRHHRVRLPVTAGRVITEPDAAAAPTVPAQQVGRDTTFVEEHVLADIVEGQPQAPLPTRRHDIRASLFVGVYGFF